MSREDLLYVIQTHTNRMAYEILILARAFVAYQAKGGDAAAVARWMREYLVGVANGKILPEVLVRFAESRFLTNKVVAMPIKDQTAIIECGTVEVIVGETESGVEMADKDPLDLSVREISQVFGPDGIRNGTQQIEWINSQEAAAKKPKSNAAPRAPRAPVPDESETEETPIKIKEEQEVWSDIPASKFTLRQVIVHFSAAEDEQLAMAAANKRLTKEKLIYKIVKASGII